MANRSVEILVLGATGFTGTFAVKYLANITRNKYSDVTWGISGRSQKKIDNLIKELENSGLNMKNVPIMECDIQNPESLHKVLRATKIVINCTGPNTILSLPVVKACIETGTHYVDISAEIRHMLNIYRDCNKAAEDASVLVIPACGFVVIPTQSAMIYLERQFNGILYGVECYYEIIIPKRAYLPGRAVAHNSTWISLVHGLGKFKEYTASFKQIFSTNSEPEPEDMKRSYLHRHNGRIWFPYPGPDTVVAEITQKNLQKKIQKKPAHIKTYTTMPTCFQFFIVPLMFFYGFLCLFSVFRRLFIRFPRLFTLGYVSPEGPTEKMRKDTKFKMVFNAKGWDSGASLLSKPTKTMSVKVSGSDPGYNCTAVAVVACAITVLKESANIPKGGVIMPGEAFYKTNIVERLMDGGYKFEVLQNKRIDTQ